MSKLATRALAAIEVLQSNGPLNALAAFPGWGPLAPAFDPQPAGQWAKVNDRLHDLLDADALRTARRCVDNSFYTPGWLIDLMWQLAMDSGFTGGRVLEPGCGTGRFMASAPDGLNISWTGVESDFTSARIAAALHPQATIHAATLQDVTLPRGSADLVIGNVPFGSGAVRDPALDLWTPSLHTYFVARALQAARDGGLVILVTSRHTMDSGWMDTVCQHQDTRHDFVGAVRLPTGAFGADGTDVVADVIVLRRNKTRPLVRVETGSRERLGTGWPAIHVSTYWSQHPGHVAGEMTQGSHHAEGVVVTTDDIPGAASKAFAALPLLPIRSTEPVAEFVPVDSPAGREGSFVVVDGQVHQVLVGELVPKRASKELLALIGLRDLAVELFAAEADVDAPDERIAPLRAQTLAAWESYVAAYGPLNRGVLHEGKIDPDTGMPVLSWRRPTLGGFRSDPDYVSVIALENYDPDTGQASPAAILTQRVNKRPVRIERVATAGEALAVSMGETGTVDLNRIASLLDTTVDDAFDALGDLVYADPARGGHYVPARRYLSGNVRHALDVARQAAAKDRAYARNVAALEAVQPRNLGPLDIRVTFGAPYVETEDIRAFCLDVIGRGARIEHCPTTGTWEVDAGHCPHGSPARTVWGTDRMNAFDLISCALNGKSPTVFDDVWDPQTRTTRRVRNGTESVAAAEKLALLSQRFETWIWEDQRRLDRICTEYNQRFNSYVPQRHDGSHLTFPGLSAGRDLWPWQRDIIDRIVSTGATLCGHPVGSGKTLSMVGAALTLRQFGLASKPMIVVPNHLLEQIAREARQAYPTGQFLIAGSDDLAGDARRTFVARCATGDWDAVVITHSGFLRLPVSADTERDWHESTIDTYEDALRRSVGGYYGSKAIARKVRSLTGKLEKLRFQAGDPDTITFEMLGVDFLAVDEAHAFKRLEVAARSEGFSFGASKRATDLLLKMRWLEKRSEGRPFAALFTGTPWTNTLAETFVWQTYLQPDVLAKAGIADLDSWAAVFVQRETKVEVAPDGSGFRLATRPTGLVNVAELQAMLSANADIRTVPLQRPDAVVTDVVVQQTPGQREFVRNLVIRADRLRQGGGNKSDNLLAICGDGRRVALDPALVGLRDRSSKLEAVAREVARIHAENPDQLQVVFCDQGTPGSNGDQSYGRMRALMSKSGVPAGRIRFIHEATTDQSRAALFAACRDGSVSVLIGSTEKMGTGTNIQTRLVAVHHADAPWRPSDIEQRNGRALRPGNSHAVVQIVRYVTEGTFDAYMWQALERKARFIAQMHDEAAGRSVEDIGDVAMDYAAVKALAAGNPVLVQIAELQATIKRLRALKSVGLASVNSSLAAAKDAKRHAERLRRQAQKLADLPNPLPDITGFDWLAGHVCALLREGKKPYTDKYGSQRWSRDLEVQVERRDNQYVLRVRLRYDDIAELPLNEKALRRSSRSALEHITKTLEAWAQTAHEQAARLLVLAVEADEQARQAQAYADSYRFAHEDELTAAIAALAALESQIEQEAA